jgi:hypothetical protein
MVFGSKNKSIIINKMVRLGKPVSFEVLSVGVDVDNDGVPDGDIVVAKDKNGNVVSRKFVPYKKMKKIVDTAVSAAAAGVKPVKRRAIKPTNPVDMPTSRIVTEDQTGFAQYLKMGVGLGAGMAVGELAVDGIASLF